MYAPRVDMEITNSAIVSINGVWDYTSSSGAFQQHNVLDGMPLREWEQYVKIWILGWRRRFGLALEHAAVTSLYPPKTFAQDGILSRLCINDLRTVVSIDNYGLTKRFTKYESDATSCKPLIDYLRQKLAIVLVGIPTGEVLTSLESILAMVDEGILPLRSIAITQSGFADTRSRTYDHRERLHALGDHSAIVMVPSISDIRFVRRDGQEARKWHQG